MVHVLDAARYPVRHGCLLLRRELRELRHGLLSLVVPESTALYGAVGYSIVPAASLGLLPLVRTMARQRFGCVRARAPVLYATVRVCLATG
jgi:hypothetical protein